MNQQEQQFAELQQRISQLECENDILRQDFASAEKRYLKLRYNAEVNVNIASRIRQEELTNEILTNRENSFQQHLSDLRELLQNHAGRKCLKVARVLQILQNPSVIGLKGRIAALAHIIKAKLKGEQIYPEYSLFGDVLYKIDEAKAVSQTSQFSKKEDDSTDYVGDQSRLISIVLPVYNQADLVHESIESVLAQTYRNWELIIVNDGSSDGLYEAVKPYLNDKRIHYLEQENQKLPAALNNGFAFATGELLTWTSADNNMRPQMLARLATFLNGFPEVDMVYADYMVIDDKGNPFTAEWFRPHNKYQANSPYLHLPKTADLLNMIQDNFIGASFMYRRSAMQLIGDYDNALGVEDYDYWMRINSSLKVAHLGTNEILYDYRVHDNTLNARAAEFKILEKVQNLMDYEKERFLFCFRNFDVYGSYDANNFYHGEFPVAYCGKHRDINKTATASKQVLLINGYELSEYSHEELGSYDYIGAVFDHGTANEIGKFAWLIRKFNILCFAEPYSAESYRIDVYTSNQVCCTPADALFRFLIHANSRLFVRKTRTPESLVRVLPVIPEKAPGRIIILLNNLGHGGIEQVAYDMAKTFMNAGEEVLLATFDGMAEGVKIPENINYTTISADAPEADFKRLLTETPCQAVFAHFCIRGAQTAFEANVPFYQIVHNTYVWLTETDIAPHIAADQYTSGYIAVSDRVAWYAIERMKLPAQKMLVIENGTDFKRFKSEYSDRSAARRKLGYNDNEFVLLNPASVYGAKGQMNLVQAFAKAYSCNNSLRLLIAGKIFEEQYFNNILAFIKENGLENVVSIGNYYENMADIYNACDAVVFSSFWEGCSLAVAEAVHFKKPLLSTKTGDVERQTDYRNCIIFDLPVRYSTDLTGETYGGFVYTPNEQIISSLADGMLKLAQHDYPATSEVPAASQSADEAYLRYLKMLNYHHDGISFEGLRHNI